jgi:lipopolysaccharide/colanic/teichoic acid biosynthesis glycosyltransferase/transposase-like protein
MNTVTISVNLGNLFLKKNRALSQPSASPNQLFFSVKEKKFTSFEKERIVVHGHSKDINLQSYCKDLNITEKTFRKWSSELLTTLPETGFQTQFDNEDFRNSGHYKLRVVRDVLNGELGVAEICNKANISKSEFYSWSQECLMVSQKRILREIADDKQTIRKRSLIIKNSSEEVLRYIENFVDVTSKEMKLNFSPEEIGQLGEEKLKGLTSLFKMNDIRFLNKYFELINRSLEHHGLFVGCFETFQARRKRSSLNSIPILSGLYFGIEFLFKRIIPKLPVTKNIYFNLTKGQDRLLSKAEGLGRLVSCGFRIIDFNSIDGLVYFVVKKVEDPKYDLNPSYGPIYKMPRIGKHGKIIKVYKLRTMHPFSEYLQDYIINSNGYSQTGKPADDFRIPFWGKLLRRFWLDELPQLINVLKGEMKLVGIRPVSQRYFMDIPKEMQKLRLTQKPGCIPPYVSLNRESNVMSVLMAEKEYLEQKIKYPLTTDLKFFVRALFNIIVKHKRSA